MDSPLLASEDLKHFTYDVSEAQFHVWINGEIHFDIDHLLSVFSKFSTSQIQDFGEFPTSDYHFIFHLLPYKHYHGVEHAFSTVITIGPATDLAEKTSFNELVGVSSHELYHFWNVCRIRPVELVPYDLSKEVLLDSGLVLEGVTTYMGDLYLLKSGYFGLSDYLKILQKQIQKEFDSFGWQNQSIVDASLDLWLDGYKVGIPDKKVSIYNRGALISLCLDLILKGEGSSLSNVMKLMWTQFGKLSKGYKLEDFQDLLLKACQEKGFINDFFERYVFGTVDLYPILKSLLKNIGVSITENFEGDELLHRWGIRIKESGIIIQIHPKSAAYQHLRINDRLLDFGADDFKSKSNWTQRKIELKVKRYEKIIFVKLVNEKERFYPIFELSADQNEADIMNYLISI